MCHHYSDVGVIYTGRDWASQGMWCVGTTSTTLSTTPATARREVYLDDCDSGDTVVGNIVFGGVGRGVLLGGGRDNTIRGNIFIGLPVGVHVDARGPSDHARQAELVEPAGEVRGGRLTCRPCGASVILGLPPRGQRTLLPLGNSLPTISSSTARNPLRRPRRSKKRGSTRTTISKAAWTTIPFLPAKGPARLDLANLRCGRRAPGFPAIPLERIGSRRRRESLRNRLTENGPSCARVLFTWIHRIFGMNHLGLSKGRSIHVPLSFRRCSRAGIGLTQRLPPQVSYLPPGHIASLFNRLPS